MKYEENQSIFLYYAGLEPELDQTGSWKPEAGPDRTGPDARSDRKPEARPDQKLEAGLEAGPDQKPEAEPDPKPDWTESQKPDTVSILYRCSIDTVSTQ